ncbi:MAG: hemerythrin domain-containing protein [Chloroflexi bacterium]|nr:hemerythrin domain-containing protein [Chloroflexota bacterium]
MTYELLDLLHQEHLKVKSTLDQLKMATHGSPQQKEELFNNLKRDLTPHFRGEEQFLYPALQQKVESRQDALESFEEHHAAKLVLNELDTTPIGEERWAAKVSVLKDMVDHHFKEEEDKIFEDARKYLTEDQMRDIMQNYQSEKSQMGRS